MTQVAYQVRVSGHVQGVLFRQSCRRQAAELGLRGWVRNERDGTVDIHVEGDPDAVQQLLDWAHHGPRHAEVSHVRVESVPVRTLHAFDIL